MDTRLVSYFNIFCDDIEENRVSNRNQLDLTLLIVGNY